MLPYRAALDRDFPSNMQGISGPKATTGQALLCIHPKLARDPADLVETYRKNKLQKLTRNLIHSETVKEEPQNTQFLHAACSGGPKEVPCERLPRLPHQVLFPQAEVFSG